MAATANWYKDKHLHEDVGIFNLFTKAFQNCPIDLKIGLMIHDPVS